MIENFSTQIFETAKNGINFAKKIPQTFSQILETISEFKNFNLDCGEIEI